MANYRKSFNFRSGVQVDNDKFLVDQRGNVGVGTSAPNRVLDVYGTTRVNGNIETETLNVTGLGTFNSLVSVGETTYLDPISGIISAVSYRGDGSLLANVIAIATNGWVVANQGLSTSLNVFVGPFPEDNVLPTPLGRFQVGTGSSIFIIQDTGGWVGLGTTVPSTKLDVRGNSSITGILTVTDKIQGNTLSISSNSNITGNLDVDGNTELDDLNVSNHTSLNTLNVSGISTLGFATATRVVSKNLEVSGITTILGQVRMQENQSLYFGITGDDPTGLVVRSTDSLGAEIVNVSNQGGDDRKITIQSLREGDIVLKGQYANRAVFTNNGATITGLTSTNSLVVSGLSTLTDAKVTGILTAPSIIGNLTGIASEAIVLSDGANITTGTISDARLPDLITSNIYRIAGISTVNKLRSNNIGIGTDILDKDFVIKKPTSVVAELISTQGSVKISLGAEEATNDNTSAIEYVPTSETLEINNYGSGGVTFHTHKGNGSLVGVQTGGFFFKTGSTNDVIAHINSDGRVAFNQEVSEDAELDYTLVTNGPALIKGNIESQGNLLVNNNLDVSSGIITTQDLVVSNTISLNPNQNFYVASGISTFFEVSITESLDLNVARSTIGVVTFTGDVSFGSTSDTSGSIINSFNKTFVYNTDFGLQSTRFLFNYNGEYNEYTEPVGLSDPRNQDLLGIYIDDPTKQVPAFGYGDIQIQTGGIGIITRDYINIHPSIAQSSTGNWPGLTPAENLGMGLEYTQDSNLCMVGINTLFTRTTFDIGHAVPSMNSYFVPPRIGTVGINTIRQLWDPNVASNWDGHIRSYQSTPYGLVSGGIIFDVDKNQLQIAVGSKTFCGVATYTNNNSGYESFVPPKVTNTQRTTLTSAGIPAGSVVYNTTNNALEQYDGTNWTSYVKKSTSDDISISVSGSNLVITVAGVGSTSLTLV
jgi:hypothetical protein